MDIEEEQNEQSKKSREKQHSRYAVRIGLHALEEEQENEDTASADRKNSLFQMSTHQGRLLSKGEILRSNSSRTDNHLQRNHLSKSTRQGQGQKPFSDQPHRQKDSTALPQHKDPTKDNSASAQTLAQQTVTQPMNQSMGQGMSQNMGQNLGQPLAQNTNSNTASSAPSLAQNPNATGTTTINTKDAQSPVLSAKSEDQTKLSKDTLTAVPTNRLTENATSFDAFSLDAPPSKQQMRLSDLSFSSAMDAVIMGHKLETVEGCMKGTLKNPDSQKHILKPILDNQKQAETTELGQKKDLKGQISIADLMKNVHQAFDKSFIGKPNTSFPFNTPSLKP